MAGIQRLSGASELRRESMCFIIAGCLDLLMTWFLIGLRAEENEVRFVEINPVAGYFLDGWGFPGLMGFKFAMVTLVVVSCWIIGTQRIVAARRVLEFAVVAGVAVVVYSVTLAIQYF